MKDDIFCVVSFEGMTWYECFFGCHEGFCLGSHIRNGIILVGEWNPERSEPHPKACCQGICLFCLIHLFDALRMMEISVLEKKHWFGNEPFAQIRCGIFRPPKKKSSTSSA